ncbi:hypothetical protein [Agarilytica rhodophyticola]|uniref:hypothetical protein n=1 Tax=Agarilytica rhodophyticola TaxID=1737490 RepID=UPI000B349752|nr:hypothetical protein [Agarilytica rhodophyticola]
MFSFFGKKNKNGTRTLTSANDLQVGDIIVFKDTLHLPESIRGQSVEVVQVGAYEFESGFEASFALKTVSGEAYFLSSENDDGETILTLSRQIQREVVEAIFDLGEIGNVLDEGFSSLKSLDSTPAEYDEWVASEYHENADCVQCYYHKTDKRGQTPAQYSDGSFDGEELNYYECTSVNGDYGVAIEVYKTGDTDISLFKCFDESVIEDLLPNAG